MLKFDFELIKDKVLRMKLNFTVGPEDDELIEVIPKI